MNRTKNAIIDTFWLLLDEKPYNKITVKDIVDCCQINRNTFYYHFHDIPELLETTVKNETDDIIRSYGKLGAHLECITYLIERCCNRKKAILHIYRSVYREYFINELEKVELYAVTHYIDTVTAEQPLPSEDKELFIRFYKCLFTGYFIDWLNNGMEYDLACHLTRINTLFDGATERAYLKSVQAADSR